MKTKAKFIVGIVLFILFVCLIAAVRLVDVAEIGPENTSVGLSAGNDAFRSLTGENMTLYKIADYLTHFARRDAIESIIYEEVF